MNTAAGRVIGMGVMWVALACNSRSTAKTSAAPDHFESAHWTAFRRVQGNGINRRPEVQFEVWMEADRALIGATGSAGHDIHILSIGNSRYAWRDGQATGKTYSTLSPDERDPVVPSVDFIYKALACRPRGKRGTTGTFDGHPFVRYDCDEPSDSTKRIYYYATDLQGFPVHATIMYPDHTVVIYDSRSIQVPASIPDSLLQKPIGVQFNADSG